MIRMQWAKDLEIGTVSSANLKGQSKTGNRKGSIRFHQGDGGRHQGLEEISKMLTEVLPCGSDCKGQGTEV